MDYIYKAVKAFHFRKGKAKVKDYEPISRIFGNKTTSDNATDYRHRDKIIEISDEYKMRLGKLYMALRSAEKKSARLFTKEYKTKKQKEIVRLPPAIIEKATAAEQEIARVKDDIHYECGFRKFFFWATPIMLLIQTITIIILAI